MDRSTRKRRQGPGQPSTKPPVRVSREKKQEQEEQKQRATKESSESNRGARWTGSNVRPSVDSDANARSFTVANVGQNGTLYLKPSRVTPTQFTQPLATPPNSAGRERADADNKRGVRWEGDASPTRNAQFPYARGNALDSTVAGPPHSLTNAHQRNRIRSHSFSTITDSLRPNEFQLLLNGQKPSQRRKSSADLSEGLLGLPIPHYRLGTPRFSLRGTAYLHNSVTSSVTEDMRSSNLSKTEYDRFPAPPGRPSGMTFTSRQASAASRLHPSQAGSSLNASLIRLQSQPSGNKAIDLVLYDFIEANINEPSLVRYSAVTGRITAATPARLIAQITSPWFLDYELLSDFFLTYRNFLTGQELLTYLMVRMKWALANDSDAGRIVTVRTFVAIRHWILNYFADDFIPCLKLRQRFCSLVNESADALRQRHDGGGSGLNVIAELKKCWRRICAMFWSVPDLAGSSPDNDIVPGDLRDSSRAHVSVNSLGQSAPSQSMHLDFRRSSVIRLPASVENVPDEQVATSPNAKKRVQLGQTANIPATPMSDQSLTVLSCSVPFLKHIKQGKEHTAAPGRPNPGRNSSSEKSVTTARRHQRSASFSDALRDDRAPLSSGQPDSVDIQSLPAASFTGGLVRGLLLQPTPSNVDLLIPLSPPIETKEFHFGETPSASPQDRQQANVGMKKIVGDVRRVLSSRKRESPDSSHRSSSSRSSGHHDRTEHLASWQQLSGPPRVDVLGEKVEESYKEVFEGYIEPELGRSYFHDPIGGAAGPSNHVDLLRTPNINRLNSHVTTGSRSIVIVDDTGAEDLCGPSLTPRFGDMAPEPLFSNPQEFDFENEATDYHPGRDSSTAVASEGLQHQPPDLFMHDLLAVPSSWPIGLASGDPERDIARARKSSSTPPQIHEVPSIQPQLRRRPGGDLKAADHIHDLEYDPRRGTGDSYSTFSQAIVSSGEPSVDLSGTHFSRPDINGLQLPLSFLQGRKKDSMTLLPTHSSQPNMRQSMKEQVSHLAKMPDDAPHGGIEDALAKLEGKAASPTASVRTIGGHEGQEGVSDMPTSARQSQPRRLQVTNASISATNSASVDGPRSPLTDRQGASIYNMSDDTQFDSNPNVRYHEDDRHVPKLRSQLQTREVAVHNVLLTDSSPKAVSFAQEHRSPLSAEFKSATSQKSFLLDDHETLSDISTEIADNQSVEESLGVRSFFFDDTGDEDVRPGTTFRAPPTPPSTAEGRPTQSAERSPIQHTMFVEPKPLKEAISAPKLLTSDRQPSQFQPGAVELTRRNTVPIRKGGTVHLPFVLAFESDAIAEQLTIIEKDALDEVDWKDLIGLRWHQMPLHTRNWVDFLKRDDCNGIDIVVSRFNLVVKWVVSECLLTEMPSERARCIAKYIHVAAHAHRLRNYATMYQITLALLSSDLARLTKTWALVAPTEKHILQRLERLCQPRGNFLHLRLEMESASADDACIPFIGLYTHDLMFNAQKPSRIDSTPPGGEPLVNFERYQTAAMIVKNLLRLIEASSKYIFRPHPELLSRCLWLAALEDSEILIRSKSLEK